MSNLEVKKDGTIEWDGVTMVELEERISKLEKRVKFLKKANKNTGTLTVIAVVLAAVAIIVSGSGNDDKEK